MTTRVLALTSTILAAATLAVGYATSRLWTGALLILACGSLWLLAQRRRWRAGSVVLAVFLVTAALGLLIGVGSGWMLLGVTAALGAWDLDRFSRRLEFNRQGAGDGELERCHLLRLLKVSGLGLLLGAVALALRLRIGFGMILLLGLLAVTGLGQLVSFLRRESD
jgi:hypothetical protein